MVKFQELRDQNEFNNPEVTEARVYGIVHALANFAWVMFKKDVWVTNVARFKDDGAFKMNPTSPHAITDDNPRSRAVDIRAHHGYWTAEELRALKNYLRQNFPRSDMETHEKAIAGWYGTLRHHGDGANEHLHICVEPLDQLWEKLGLG